MEPIDPALASIASKVRRGVRLDAADGEAIFQTRDLHALGALADEVRRRRHGRRAYYIVNRHINYTNRCVLACRFCGFRRGPDGEGARDMTIDEIAAAAAETARAGGTEVHVTGGLHPTWRIDHYERMVRAIRSAGPRLHVKAFTAVEIAHIARLSELTAEEVLRRLSARGLDSLPGGGAEIFDSRVQEAAFARKMGAEAWFDVHRIAHALRLPTNATMLYGHVETHAERVRHMLRLRALQDETGGFQAFVPLSFVPAGSALSDLPGPTGLDDLRTVAAGRLLLDNFPHVKAFWPMLTMKLAQVALGFGADDLDGTVGTYQIATGEAAGGGPVTAEDLRRAIAAAGLEPVLRDSLYRPIDIG